MEECKLEHDFVYMKEENNCFIFYCRRCLALRLREQQYPPF
jgi:hypothetical protein